jgi:hypothetical protein
MATLTINGQRVTVDDAFLSLPPDQQNAAVEEIAAALPTNAPTANVAEGAGRMAEVAQSGLMRGIAAFAKPIAAIAGAPGMLQELAGRRAQQPTPSDVLKPIEMMTDALPKPQTTAEKYVHTAAEFIPGSVVGPGGLLRKALQYGVTPGVASEYAGQRTEGTALETPARIAGALLGIGAGAGGGAAFNALKNRIAAGRTGSEIADVVGSPVGAGATRRLAESIEADRITPASAAKRQAELGPDAMVMDLGRQMRGRAEAIAAQPGRGQNTVLDAVERRTGQFGEGTAARVEQMLNRELGPSHNVVQLEKTVSDVVDRVAKPLYQKVMDAHPVVTVPESITSRPAVSQAMKQAETLAKQYGEKLSATESKTILKGPGFHIADDVTQHGKTSLKYWDYVKKALDARVNSYMKSGGTSELSSADKADLGGLMSARRALVEALDEITGGAYAEARRAAATKFELREALDFGRTAFNSKLLPEEFIAALSDMSIPEQAMAKAGFRRELDRIIQSTRSEGATARRLLDTSHVLQKAEALFGPQAAREIERTIAAENVFQSATQDIARNSRTAVRQELIKDTSTPSSSEVRGTSLPGLAWAAARGGLNYIRRQGTDRTREQIANVLTARGDKIDPVVNALREFAEQRKLNTQPIGNKLAAIINALMQSREERANAR